MATARSLQQTAPNPSRAELTALEVQVGVRERELRALKVELQDLQTKYLSELGPLYEELGRLEAAIADEETRRGIRPPELFDDEEPAAEDAVGTGCSHRAAPSTNLKKMFRDVARAVHPDRAMDDRARFRRHSLMAEANRAYAERDEDRLRLILRAWELSPESAAADESEPEEIRVRRRLTLLSERMVEIDAEFAELRGSAIARLKHRIDDTAGQGWDLFAEMLRHVKREIARASALLTKHRRQLP